MPHDIRALERDDERFQKCLLAEHFLLQRLNRTRKSLRAAPGGHRLRGFPGGGRTGCEILNGGGLQFAADALNVRDGALVERGNVA